MIDKFSKMMFYILIFFQIVKYKRTVDMTDRFTTMETARKIINNTYNNLNSELVVEGLENVPDKSGILFVSNHQDIGDISNLLSGIDRPLSFIAKKELEKFFGIGTYIIGLGGILIERDSVKSQLKSINSLTEKLKEGYDVAVFPEGTRSHSKEMGEFKHGAFRMAQKSKCKIVPVVMHNSYEMVFKFRKKQKTYMSVLEPLDYEDYKNMSTKELSNHVENLIREKLKIGYKNS